MAKTTATKTAPAPESIEPAPPPKPMTLVEVEAAFGEARSQAAPSYRHVLGKNDHLRLRAEYCCDYNQIASAHSIDPGNTAKLEAKRKELLASIEREKLTFDARGRRASVLRLLALVEPARAAMGASQEEWIRYNNAHSKHALSMAEHEHFEKLLRERMAVDGFLMDARQLEDEILTLAPAPVLGAFADLQRANAELAKLPHLGMIQASVDEIRRGVTGKLAELAEMLRTATWEQLEQIKTI